MRILKRLTITALLLGMNSVFAVDGVSINQLMQVQAYLKDKLHSERNFQYHYFIPRHLDQAQKLANQLERCDNFLDQQEARYIHRLIEGRFRNMVMNTKPVTDIRAVLFSLGPRYSHHPDIVEQLAKAEASARNSAPSPQNN